MYIRFSCACGHVELCVNHSHVDGSAGVHYSQLSASLTGAVHNDSAWNLSMTGQVNHHPSPKFISPIFALLLSLFSAICAASGQCIMTVPGTYLLMDKWIIIHRLNSFLQYLHFYCYFLVRYVPPRSIRVDKLLWRNVRVSRDKPLMFLQKPHTFLKTESGLFDVNKEG